MPAENASGGPLHLGPFAVRAETEEAEAFGRATGGGAGRVPFTFPIRWLARPEIRAAAALLIGETAWVPIHESQSFDYRKPLESATDYRMSVEMAHEPTPPRLVLRAEVTGDSGECCLGMEMILRIVAIAQARTGAGGE